MEDKDNTLIIELNRIGGLHVVGLGNPKTGELIGSGTYVTVNNIPGILTAAHVITETKTNDYRIFFANKKDAEEYRDNLVIKDVKNRSVMVGSNPYKSESDDIAFIQIDEETCQILDKSLFAAKSVDKLVDEFDKIKDKFVTIDGGYLFGVTGFVEEFSKIINDGTGEGESIQYIQPVSIICKRVDHPENSSVSVLELEGDKKDDEPSSYGGVSGAGVWFYMIATTEDAVTLKGVLGGVACHEEITEHSRKIYYQNISAIKEIHSRVRRSISSDASTQ